MVLSVQPDCEPFPIDPHLEPATPNDDVVKDQMLQVEGEGVHYNKKLLRPDSPDVLYKKVINPGMLVVIDAAISAWLACDRIVMFEAVWKFRVASEKHHTDVFQNELGCAQTQSCVGKGER